MGYRVVGSGCSWLAARRVSRDRSYRLVLTFTLINDLLKEKSADAKYGENGPDFQGGLALGSTDVGRGFVGTCGVTWLTAIKALSGGAELVGSFWQSETNCANLESSKCCRHGRCGSGYDDGGCRCCAAASFTSVGHVHTGPMARPVCSHLPHLLVNEVKEKAQTLHILHDLCS